MPVRRTGGPPHGERQLPGPTVAPGSATGMGVGRRPLVAQGAHSPGSGSNYLGPGGHPHHSAAPRGHPLALRQIVAAPLLPLAAAFSRRPHPRVAEVGRGLPGSPPLQVSRKGQLFGAPLLSKALLFASRDGPAQRAVPAHRRYRRPSASNDAKGEGAGPALRASGPTPLQLATSQP